MSSFAALVALPVLLFLMYPQSQAVNNELAEARERHLMLAESLGGMLARHHANLIATFEHLRASSLTSTDAATNAALAEAIGLSHVIKLDRRTGAVSVLTASRAGGSHAGLSASVGERAMAMRDAPTLVTTPLLIDESGASSMFLLRRVGDQVFIASVSTTYFSDLASSVAVGSGGHALIVDGTGRVIGQPANGWVRHLQDVSSLAPIRKILSGGRGVEVFHADGLNGDLVAGYSAVPGAGWGVLVPQPISELRDKAQKIRDGSLLVFAFGLLLAALLALRAALLVVEPIQRLVRAAARIEAGESAVSLPLPSRFAPEELRVLTARFNAMAQSLESARAAEHKARLDAERANQFKTDFLRTVAHELRSPLNAMLGFAELLLADRAAKSLSAVQKERIEDIRAGGEHLVSLTGDLLDLSRIEAGRYELDIGTVGLDELTERCRRFLLPLARSRSINLTIAGHDMPDVRVDERAMLQVLLNLTANSIKYGNDGGTIRIETRRNADASLAILVRDDGPGIPGSDLQRLMEPFQRMGNERTRAVPGTGLGLPIVKRLVELHGGTFWLESEVGLGTTAVVTLPASAILGAAPVLDASRSAA